MYHIYVGLTTEADIENEFWAYAKHSKVTRLLYPCAIVFCFGFDAVIFIFFNLTN